MTFKSLQDNYLPQFELALKKAIQFNLSDQRSILEESINYCVTSPGKRIRPILCMVTEKNMTGNISMSIPISVAIELVHCYSLIHDDLPAMDNDDFRRGKPTCHKAYGEDIAILSGDVLNTYVFEYLANELPNYTDHETSLTIIKEFAHACGIHGMAGGQVLDLKSSNNNTADLDQLKKIHHLKTGALLKSCITLISKVSSNDPEILNVMNSIGHHFGLLFQIIDDILDETGDLESIGKSPGKDLAQNKLTYVSLLGLDQAVNEAKNHKNKGLELIAQLPTPSEELSSIFNYIFDKGIQYAK